MGLIDGPAHFDCTKMNARLIIDKAGRVVIPKPLRIQLQLEPGDGLELESAGEEITLRPVRGTGPLTKELGVWVFRAGLPLPASATDDMLRQIREERDLANRGALNAALTEPGPANSGKAE
jgi:AbrB family looped-hinge helix DNA binding protein